MSRSESRMPGVDVNVPSSCCAIVPVTNGVNIIWARTTVHPKTKLSSATPRVRVFIRDNSEEPSAQNKRPGSVLFDQRFPEESGVNPRHRSTGLIVRLGDRIRSIQSRSEKGPGGTSRITRAFSGRRHGWLVRRFRLAGETENRPFRQLLSQVKQ